MAELAPLQTFLFEHGEVIGRSSLRFKLLFNRKVILRRSQRCSVLLFNRRQFCGGARSASNFYLTESNSAAELAPLQTFI